MLVFHKWLVTSLASMALVTLVETASAGVIINVVESGGNVVATLSGQLSNLGVGTTQPPPINPVSSLAAIYVNLGGTDSFVVQSPGSYETTRYNLSGTASQWGPFAFTNANDFTLSGTNYLSFNNSSSGGSGGGPGGNLVLGSYTFGDSISATLTFTNKTLAAMGLVNQGSYVYTVGSGPNTDTITFNIGGGGGGAAVPEPSSLAICSIAAAAAAIRARRKAKAKA